MFAKALDILQLLIGGGLAFGGYAIGKDARGVVGVAFGVGAILAGNVLAIVALRSLVG